MSAFNTFSTAARCPVCGHEAPFEIQFKYGDTWQYRYVVSDELRWGGNDYGSRTEGRVTVDGLGGPCPSCRHDDLPFTITVIDNRLESAAPAAIEPDDTSGA